MPSIQYKIQSIATKFYLKRHLESLLQSPEVYDSSYGIVSRSDEAKAPANPSFSGDGVATKDVHIDPLSSLSLRIFLPDSAISSNKSHRKRSKLQNEIHTVYKGYQPDEDRRTCRKLPVILQFHGGIWVTGGNNTVGNDAFCRRLAKLCDAIVVAVGYRLAPESKYPAAFEDGVKVLTWLGMQANLAECDQLSLRGRFGGGGGGGGRRLQIVDGSLASMIDPWLAAHADPSRCVLLGSSSGANIANYVTQKAVEAGKMLHPLRVVAQVLMHPLFMGSIPTISERKLANSYVYDRAISVLAWKLFLADEEFCLDHPAANPLNRLAAVPLKRMPPTLTVVAEYDWTRDCAIAYCEELRKVNVDSPLLDYKNTVHEFATIGSFLKTPVAKACTEDVAIWMKKYISLRDNEFSY